jgi:hypothetical protein
MERELKRVMVSIRMNDDTPPEPVAAYTTPVAGLVVHPGRKSVWRSGKKIVIARRNKWAISLYPVGLRVVGEIPTREQAVDIVITRFAKYQWVGLVVDDIRNTNDMDVLAKEAANARRYIETLKKP